MLDPDQLARFLFEKAKDPLVAMRIRNYLGVESALNEGKVKQWKPSTESGEGREVGVHRRVGVPLALLEGASLVHLELNADTRDPRLGALIPPLEAETAYHIFNVETPEPGEKADVNVCRYWQGVRRRPDTSEATHYLTNSNVGEFEFSEFNQIGRVGKVNQASANRLEHGGLIWRVRIGSQEAISVGYRFKALKVQETRAAPTPPQKDAPGANSRVSKLHWEFVSAMSSCWVNRVYLIASVPKDMVAEHPAYAFNFAAPMSANRFLLELGMNQYLHEVYEPRNTLHGFFDLKQSGIRFADHWNPHSHPLPKELEQELNNGWLVRGSERKVFFAEFERPHPLTLQAIMYKLSEPDAG